MYNYLFDIAVLGSENVGKKTFAKSKFLDSFSGIDDMKLIGMEFAFKTVKLKDTIVKLTFRILSREKRWWDNTRKIHLGIHIRYLHGAIIFYDITNPKSLELIPQWIKNVKDNAGDVPILLVGNKIDLKQQRKITSEKVLRIKNDYKLSSSMEISVKTGENVENMFITLTSKILNESKELLESNRDHYIYLIEKAIEVEDRKFIDRKSLRMHRKIWRKLYKRKDVSFDEYLNRQKEILRKFIEMRKAILNATSFLDMRNIWEEVEDLVKLNVDLHYH